MRNRAKTNYLISEVKAKIKSSFSQWCVGTTEHDDIWHRNKWAEIIVFNVLDREATRDAYEYLVDAGMTGNRPIGRQPNYLYLYSKSGRLPDGFVF